MTDKEKAEEYAQNCKYVETDYFVNKIAKIKAIFLDGLAEGRKEKWHDLRKNPDDLPKESDKYLCAWEGGEQWIMDFETEVNSFGYWCNTYDSQSLGFIDSVFETIKERGEDEVIAWCELPKFEE